ncbi:unnamed protein product [Heterosigma akashiwo]
MFLDPLKDLCERVPARERPQALLAYCRGLWTPGHGLHASGSNGGVYEVIRKGLYTPYLVSGEGDAFQAAKGAYPFLEIPALWARMGQGSTSYSSTRVVGLLQRLQRLENGATLIKGLRKWAVQFLLGPYVDDKNERLSEYLQQNEVALSLTTTYKIFVDGESGTVRAGSCA